MTRRPTSSQNGARKRGAMAQAKLKQNKPSWPNSLERPRSSHIRSIPLLYAVVANPMKSVIRQRRRVIHAFLPSLQLNGSSLSSSVNFNTMCSCPSLCTVSQSVSGKSISTSFKGPSSASESLSWRCCMNDPPAILPFWACLSVLSSCLAAGKSELESSFEGMSFRTFSRFSTSAQSWVPWASTRGDCRLLVKRISDPS